MAAELISAVHRGRDRYLHSKRSAKQQAYSVEFKREVIRLAEEEGITGVKLQEKVKAVLHYDVHTSTLAHILKGKSKWMEARSLVSTAWRGKRLVTPRRGNAGLDL